MGNGVQRHVDDVVLIGVVEAAAGQRRTCHGGAQLNAYGHGEAGDGACLDELTAAGDGVVVHDAGGGKTCLHRAPDGGGGGVGREGIDGVDVIVNILELTGNVGLCWFVLIAQIPERRETIGGGRRVQRGQNGLINGHTDNLRLILDGICRFLAGFC